MSPDNGILIYNGALQLKVKAWRHMCAHEEAIIVRRDMAFAFFLFQYRFGANLHRILMTLDKVYEHRACPSSHWISVL